MTTLTQRQKFVRRTYLAFALPTSFALVIICAGCFVRIFDLPLNTPLRKESLLIQVGFFASMFVPLLVGFSIGGWIWSRLGKRYLGITRVDMEDFLLGGTYRIGSFDRANRRAINKLFPDHRND
ncbi:MAG: hypothetical protein ACRETW_12405 [Stenotrophobium sp.]